MAKIEFQGWVEKELISSSGTQFGITVAEPHSKKDESGKWVTVARTFHVVKGNATAGFRKGERVTVSGNQKTEAYTAQNETKYRLVVWADSVDIAGQTQTTAAPDTWTSSGGAWPADDPELPF